MKILVLTVGGSCAPIVTSIKQNKPDVIHFICSDDIESTKGSYRTVIGEGKVCGTEPKNPNEANILEQAGIPKEKEGEVFSIHKIKDFDNFNNCFIESLNLLKFLIDKYPNAEIIADYTGGTKSMSVGLGAASMNVNGITICFIKGTRPDLIKIQDGTQRISLTPTNLAFLNKQIEAADSLIERYDYDSAISILLETAKHPNIPEGIDEVIQRKIVLSKAFLAWDYFDHENAWKLLNIYRKSYLKNVLFLEAVICNRKKIDNDYASRDLPIHHKDCNYELVEDLVLNAERRAKQGRFDDAVARLYRALELLVQLRLKLCYSIKTSDVDVEKIPEMHRQEYEGKQKEGKIQIALLESYELLIKLGKDDPLAKIYIEKQKNLQTQLLTRNNSLYAHGFNPISKKQYERFYNAFVEDVLDNFLSHLKAKRIPRYQFRI